MKGRRSTGPWRVARRVLPCVLGLAAGWTMAPPGAAAQLYTLEARAGQLRSEAGPGLETSTASLSLGVLGRDALLVVSGGIPLRREESLWGAVAGWKRLAVAAGPFILGVDVSADAFGQKDRVGQDPGGDGPVGGLLGDSRTLPAEPLTGWSVTGEAMPLVALVRGPVEAQARIGAVFHRSDFAGSTFDRTVRQADARLGWTPEPGTGLTLIGRHVRADEGRYTRAAVVATARLGGASLRAGAGRWLGAEDVDGTDWSASLRVPVSGSVSLGLGGRHRSFDPVRLSASHTTWGVGVGWTFGGGAPGAPTPSHYENGRATIVLPEGDAGPRPRIAGDFTDWKPVPMERGDEGWRYTVALEAGVYHYAFVGPDGTWFVPESSPGRRDDGFGGHVAVLVVEDS